MDDAKILAIWLYNIFWAESIYPWVGNHLGYTLPSIESHFLSHNTLYLVLGFFFRVLRFFFYIIIIIKKVRKHHLQFFFLSAKKKTYSRIEKYPTIYGDTWRCIYKSLLAIKSADFIIRQKWKSKSKLQLSWIFTEEGSTLLVIHLPGD